MQPNLPITIANPFMIDQDIFTVEVSIGGGRYAYHVGSPTHPYFTIEQAEALARRVNNAGCITPTHWLDGSGFPLAEGRHNDQYLIHSDVEDRPDEDFN